MTDGNCLISAYSISRGSQKCVQAGLWLYPGQFYLSPLWLALKRCSRAEACIRPLIKMDINTEAEDQAKSIFTNPLSCFPNQLGISRAIFSQPFQESAFTPEPLITFCRIVLEAPELGAPPTSRSPVKRKRQSWRDDARQKRLRPSTCLNQAMHRSLTTPRGQQKAITCKRLMAMLGLKERGNTVTSRYIVRNHCSPSG